MKTIDHVALLVDDLDAAQTWYEEKLEAICEFSDSFYRRMRFNNSTVALISKHRYPYAHIGILVDNKEDLPQVGERVEHRDGTIGVYTFDPDGNCVEHIWYNDECKKKVRNEDE
jgi:catechol 2,3-dioxygenase-like lactoylglutathione lyase family enzyme